MVTNTTLISAESAVRRMTWRDALDDSENTLPPGILRSFNGATKDGWTATVVVYRVATRGSAEATDVADGAVTCIPQGLVIHMTPHLAEVAASCALRSIGQ